MSATPPANPRTTRHRSAVAKWGWTFAPALILSLAAPLVTAAPASAQAATTTNVAAAQPAAGTLSVRQLQQRLAYAYMQPGAVDGVMGPQTRAAIRRFQYKFELPITGIADPATMRSLVYRTNKQWGIRPECRARVKAICVSKTLRLVRVLEHGRVIYSMHARFGGPGVRTREGAFSVGRKGNDCNHDGKVTFAEAKVYHNLGPNGKPCDNDGILMPFPLFFSGGQAVHYSPHFDANWYNGNSSGCVNTLNFDRMAELWRWAEVYTSVYVYHHTAW